MFSIYSFHPLQSGPAASPFCFENSESKGENSLTCKALSPVTFVQLLLSDFKTILQRKALGRAAHLTFYIQFPRQIPRLPYFKILFFFPFYQHCRWIASEANQ